MELLLQICECEVRTTCTTATVASAKAGTIVASGTKIKGVTANNIDVASRDGVTSVVVKDVQVGATRRRVRRSEVSTLQAFGCLYATGELKARLPISMPARSSLPTDKLIQ